jgi:nucleoside-diphosphate-sugar epimerase
VKDPKILITGGAGYIGSVLSEKLLSLGYAVTVLDTQMYNKTSLISCVRYGNKFNFIRGDVRNESELKKLVDGHDVLIPLAALVGAPLCDKNPVDAELINYKHIKNMCDWKSSHQWIIYPNSNSGYGATDGTSECTEESPMSPISIYGTTKLRAEYACREVDNHVTLRLATVFGASPRPRFDLLVNNLVMRAVKEKIIVLYDCFYNLDRGIKELIKVVNLIDEPINANY